jgi:DNA-binding MarR family transcriptional regulator
MPSLVARTGPDGDSFQSVGKSGSKSASAAFLIARDGWFRVLCSHPNLSGSDFAVAVVLALHVNRKTGTAWPAIKTIAKITNRAPSTVWRSLSRLEKQGLITVVHSRSAHKSNRYRLSLGVTEHPADLRRRTTTRGIMRTRNTGPANSQHRSCELATWRLRTRSKNSL